MNVPYLDAILFILGVTRDEVERADLDSEDPIGNPHISHG